MKRNVKICTKCGAEKPLTDFYKHPTMADGHLGKCKECHISAVIENRFAKVEYYREYDKRRIAENPARRDLSRKTVAAWIEKHPDRRAAHSAVLNAIRDGRLNKEPCEVCVAEMVHGHHDDYSKPLEVRWLCPAHHRQWHVANG